MQEIDRAEAQETADSLKGAEERNKLGQFSTPFLLADQMVKHALSFLDPATPLRFLEPAVGTGVFFSALLRNVDAARIQFATGCEIDPSYGDIAQKIWRPHGLKILSCDFIDFATDPNHFGVRLKDLVVVRRGIATGANDYFIIDSQTVAQYEIPCQYLKPILPGPRYLHDTVIDAAPDGTPRLEGFRYLLACTASPDEVKRKHPGLWAYFEEGIAQGLPEHHLCAHREVWYFQEKREPAPFLASYMGRSCDVRSCPIRFFANFSSALVTNGFLNLYPTPDFSEILGNNRTRIIEFAEALNAIPAEAIFHAGRAYGGGLHKIEPKELCAVPLLSLPTWLSDSMKKCSLAV